ncbi:hypothetical protein K1719_015186 [Acacia pycnantha]|nr:hypothetical protein K1719_015186 [Acacia pycnantha]
MDIAGMLATEEAEDVTQVTSCVQLLRLLKTQEKKVSPIDLVYQVRNIKVGMGFYETKVLSSFSFLTSGSLSMAKIKSLMCYEFPFDAWFSSI